MEENQIQITILNRLEDLERRLLAKLSLLSFTENESKKLNDLYLAFSKAKVEYNTLRFNRVNSFNKQVYADLEALQRATDSALSKYELVFFQEPRDEDGTTFLYSTLGHSSGQEIVCKNRIILEAGTGAKSQLQRFGEAIAYTKRQVAQAMLGIVACNDPEDNDDADASEYRFNNEAFRSAANDPKPARSDDGIFTEKIAKHQLDDLYMELQDYPILTKTLLKGKALSSLADMPKAMFTEEITRIRSMKLALRNSPTKEW